MTMRLLVLLGAQEGYTLLKLLQDRAWQVVAVPSGAYGRALLADWPQTHILMPDELARVGEIIVSPHALDAVVSAMPAGPRDSTAQLVWRRCRDAGIPFIQMVRPATALPAHPLVVPVDTWEEAAQHAATCGETVFLTTGSNNLAVFCQCGALAGKRLVVRVLPEHQIVRKCQELGIPPRDIVALHGPFSREFNRQMFKAYHADVVVTRDSGPQGGTTAKIQAALSLGIPVVVIRRAAQADAITAAGPAAVMAQLERLDRGERL